MERRLRARVSLQCPVIFANTWCLGEARVVNVSLWGCGIEAHTVPRTHDYLRLQILFPDDEGTLSVMLAKVWWVQASEETRRSAADACRFGLQFLVVAAEEHQQFAQYLDTFIPLRMQRPTPYRFHQF